MKLLWARCCATLVVPHQKDFVVRWCGCRQSAVWWEDGALGKLALFNAAGSWRIEGLGLHNDLLRFNLAREGCGTVTLPEIKTILEATPSSYVFKQVESLIIKFRPGYTNDVKFISNIKDVPQQEEVSEIKHVYR